MTVTFDLIGGAAGIVALVGILVLTPLYASHLRDLQRLRAWREVEPERGDPDPYAPPLTEDGTIGDPVTALTTDPGHASDAARRVTSERPALSRTMEHAALVLDPADSRFGSRIPQPRHPLVIALAAVLAAAVISVTALAIWSAGGGGDDGAAEFAVDPSQFSVAVINATRERGLSEQLRIDIEELGFETNDDLRLLFEEKRASEVRYEEGNRPAAKVLAENLNLGSKPKPMDAETRAETGGADLAFVIGADRLGKN